MASAILMIGAGYERDARPTLYDKGVNMTMTNDTVHQFKIPSDNMASLATVFTKLGKRAKRLGLPAPTFQDIGTERKVQDQGTRQERTFLIHTIIVDPGTSVIKVNGWTFTATIQHTDDGNILRNIGGTDLPLKYRTASDLCEHCNTNRYRKQTYILRNDTTGQYKQVGRNCLSDFFGHDALMYAERAQYLLDLEDQCGSMEGSGGQGPQYYRLELYLGHVAECIAREGWMSRGAARKLDNVQATADQADRHMTDPGYKDRLYLAVSEESRQLAEQAIEWCESIEGEDVNEYIHNIRTIARSGVVSAKTMGMGASIVSTYQREVVKQLELKRRACMAPSEYQGTVGEKGIFHLLVEKVIQCDSEWGTSFLHIMSDDQGNRFTYFFNSSPLNTAKQYVLKGKVKAHTEYKGTKQTVLSRCEEVALKNYSVTYEGQTYSAKAESEKEFQGMAKAALGIRRWSRSIQIVESHDDTLVVSKEQNHDDIIFGSM